MKIIYTRHARQRMKQRGIKPEQVEETLHTPDDVLAGDYQEEIAIKNYGNREVRVVYEETASGVFVIYTAIKPRAPIIE